MKPVIVSCLVLTGIAGMIDIVNTHHPAGMAVALLSWLAAGFFNEVMK